jgi:hypothetical protein
MPKERWDEWSGFQKGAIVLSGAVQLGLLVAAARGDPGRKATVGRCGVHQLHRPIACFLFGR